MPLLPTPAASGDVWGTQLNNFLTQLQSGTDGSVNYSATRPAKTAADIGYTMIDTVTKEIIRWSGTAWETLLAGNTAGSGSIVAAVEFSPAAFDFLVGSLTFFVRPIRSINVKPQIFARTLFSNFNYSYKIDFINPLPDTNYLVLVSAGRNDYIVDSTTTDSVSISLSLEAPFPLRASVTIIR